MMRRYIGTQRAKADAQAAVRNGVDPETAQQNALLNNADLIFSDNPEAIASIANSQKATQLRERALLQTQQHQEFQGLLGVERNRIAKERADQAAKHAADALEETKRYNTGRLNAANTEFPPRIENVTDEATGDTYPILRKSPKTSEMLNAKGNPHADAQERRLSKKDDRSAKIQVEKLLQADAAYADLAKSVVDARAALASTTNRKGSKIPLYGTTDADVTKATTQLTDTEKALNEYRQKVGRKFNVDMTVAAAPTAPKDEPSKLTLTVGKKYRNADGKVMTYHGVDAEGNPIWRE
jgi:hypothetical protein